MHRPLSILVTGSAGRIGRAVVAELTRRGHAVRGFDRAPTPGLADFIIGDLNDRAVLDRAMHGVRCLIHLAATPDDDDFFTQLLPNNIAGLYHVMESARAAGVARIVLASSGQVNWWQQRTGPFPIRPEDPTSPRSWYAATKMFMAVSTTAMFRSFPFADGMTLKQFAKQQIDALRMDASLPPHTSRIISHDHRDRHAQRKDRIIEAVIQPDGKHGPGHQR